MQEIVRVAKEERIIIVCTIHQPSTKVSYPQLISARLPLLLKAQLLFSGLQ